MTPKLGGGDGGGVREVESEVGGGDGGAGERATPGGKGDAEWVGGCAVGGATAGGPGGARLQMH